jgi:hypothetical protein
MEIKADDGKRFKLRTTPEWSEYHQRFYAYGFRWIKTKQAYSTVSLLHNFKSYEVTSGAGS